VNYRIHKAAPEGFEYGIAIDRMLDFHDVRRWLLATYGYAENTASPYWTLGESLEQHWSWAIAYQNYAIFLRGDSELGWFKLKFGG
jgi:hypothetical protein